MLARARQFVLAALAATVAASSAAAQTVNWGGAGASGTDPFGHGWTFDTEGGDLVWGIPGFGNGSEQWAAPGSLASFRIRFGVYRATFRGSNGSFMSETFVETRRCSRRTSVDSMGWLGKAVFTGRFG